MPTTPDPVGDELNLRDFGLDPVYTGAISNNGGNLKGRDTLGVFNLRGVPYYEFLLDNDPIAETGATDATYTPTYSGILATKEEWKRNDTTLIKSIDYTYTGVFVTTEVRKVFALDGTTIVAQVTWTYTRSGPTVTSATMVRDV